MTDEEGLPTAAPDVVEGHEVAEPEIEAAEPTTEPTPPRKQRGLLVLSIVLGIAALGFAVVAAVALDKLSDERGDRQDVEEASGAFASALLTYDYQDLDRAKNRVLELSTGKFRAEYEKAFDGGLDVLFRETQARSAGTVKDVFVGPIEDDTVTTIVVADAVAQGTAGGRRLISSYIELQLVKVKGVWKVDGVSNLNLAAPTSESPIPAPGTTTTTTPK